MGIGYTPDRGSQADSMDSDSGTRPSDLSLTRGAIWRLHRSDRTTEFSDMHNTADATCRAQDKACAALRGHLASVEGLIDACIDWSGSSSSN
jgi:hypothetical protein